MFEKIYYNLLAFLVGCIFTTILFVTIPTVTNKYTPSIQGYSTVEQFIINKGYKVPERELLDHLFFESYKNNVDPFIIISIIIVESGFNENAFSNHGAIGLMQVVPKWHKVDPYQLLNPYYNISKGIEIYASMLKATKLDDIKALTKYSGDKSLRYAGKVLSVRAALVKHESY